MQGVVKSYDPGSGDGLIVRDSDLVEFEMAEGALEGSIFRMLRQGERVVFELDGDNNATGLKLGSEVDMGTPCLLYTSPSPRDGLLSRMPSSA